MTIFTTGGWCAPSMTVYDVDQLRPVLITIPEVKITRGGITYPQPPVEGSIEYQRQLVARRAEEALAALIARKIGDVRRAQAAVENWAIRHALANDYAVHLHTNWGSRFIGVEFVPATDRDFTVHHHNDDTRWAEWDE